MEEVKAIPGLRGKGVEREAQTKKKPRQGVSLMWLLQGDFSSTGTSEKCMESIPEKSLWRAKAGPFAQVPTGVTLREVRSPWLLGYSCPWPEQPLQLHRGCGPCLGGSV